MIGGVVGDQSEATPRDVWLAVPLWALVAIASLPLVVISASLWHHGWTPTGDNAVIALRSFDVFTRASPLVGHINLGGTAGQPAFDPGPLQNWALAIPVRLFPLGIGAVVGATLVNITAVATMIVAADRVAGRGLAVLITAGVLNVIWTAAPVFMEPVWNPYTALLPFGAVLLTAWAVGLGHLKWWPVTILFASYCVQAHLVYGPAVVALALLSPVLGVVLRRRDAQAIRSGPLLSGVAVGAMCWAAPIYQQFRGKPGNFSVLLHALLTTNRPRVGPSLALDRIGKVVVVDHALVGAPRIALDSVDAFRMGGTGLWAGLLLALVVAALVKSTVVGDRTGAVLAATALVGFVGVWWALAGLLHSSIFAMGYLISAVWLPVTLGVLAIGWALVVGDAAPLRGVLQRATRVIGRARRAPSGAAAALFVISVAISALLAPRVLGFNLSHDFSWATAGPVSRAIAAAVAPKLPTDEPVEVSYAGRQADPLLQAGLVYQLRARGRHPTASGLAVQLDPYYAPVPRSLRITVTDRDVRNPPAGERVLADVRVRDSFGEHRHFVVTLGRLGG